MKDVTCQVGGEQGLGPPASLETLVGMPKKDRSLRPALHVGLEVNPRLKNKPRTMCRKVLMRSLSGAFGGVLSGLIP